MADFDKLKEFIDLAKSEGVAELKYEGNDHKFFVSFNASPATTISTPLPIGQPLASKAGETSVSSSEKFHEVTSPFVGTYYGSPAPGKPAFAKVGDRVSKGQTLCILEAMKIMNEIESDADGEVVEVCVGNEDLVEFGQVLFKIKA